MSNVPEKFMCKAEHPKRGPDLWGQGYSKGRPALRSGDVLALEGFHCVSSGKALPFGSREHQTPLLWYHMVTELHFETSVLSPEQLRGKK